MPPRETQLPHEKCNWVGKKAAQFRRGGKFHAIWLWKDPSAHSADGTVCQMEFWDDDDNESKIIEERTLLVNEYERDGNYSDFCLKCQKILIQKGYRCCIEAVGKAVSPVEPSTEAAVTLPPLFQVMTVSW